LLTQRNILENIARPTLTYHIITAVAYSTERASQNVALRLLQYACTHTSFWSEWSRGSTKCLL